MKGLYSAILYTCLIGFWAAPVKVYSQFSQNNSPASVSQNKVVELFQQHRYAAVLSEMAFLKTPDTDAGKFGFVGEEELSYCYLASGIMLGEAAFVRKGKDAITEFRNPSLASKLSFHLGHYYFLEQQFDEAIGFYEKTDSLFLSTDEMEQFHFEKGISFFSMNKFNEARESLNHLLGHEESVYSKDASYYLGCILFSERKYDEALKMFVQLEGNTSYDKVIPFYLAYLYHLKADDEKTIKYGESYLKSGNGLHLKEMQLLLASVYFNKRMYPRSVDLYERAINAGTVLNPDQRFELGSGYYHLEKHAKAIEQLKPLSAGKDTVAYNSMYLLGHAYLHLGDKKNARSAFQYCLGTTIGKEKLELVEFLISKLSMELGFEDQGLQGLTTFMKKYPDSDKLPEVREIVLLFYSRTNDFKQAIELFGDLDRSSNLYNTLAPRIFFGRAIELFNGLQYDSSVVLFNQVTTFKKSSFYPPSLFWKAEIAFRKKEYRKTISLLEEYIKLPSGILGESRQDNAFYNLGYAYMELEEYAKALVYFEKLNALYRNSNTEISRESVLRAADCALMENDLVKAKNLYTRISTSNGYGADYALFQLAVMFGASSPVEKIKLLKEVEIKYPDSELMAMVAMELADTYLAEEDFTSAIPSLQKIPDLVDKDDEFIPSAQLKLGIALYNLGKDDEAINQFRQILEKYPTSSQSIEALDNARAIFVEKGKINDYQQFLEMSGKSIGMLQKDSLYFQYVQTTYAEGNSLPSHNAISEYLKQFPTGMYRAEVLNYQSELFLKEKDWTNAAQSFDQLAALGISKHQERALRQAGRIYFFELKNYQAARMQFAALSKLTVKPDVLLESLKGEIRSCYYMKLWPEAENAAQAILSNENANQDDKAIATLLLGYFKQKQGSVEDAYSYFKKAMASGNNPYAAEAGYQVALNYFKENKLESAESFALKTIENAGSADYWKARSYLLLSDIALIQQDYFNAKATLKSIVEHAKYPELKNEATEKLKAVELKERGKDKK